MTVARICPLIARINLALGLALGAVEATAAPAEPADPYRQAILVGVWQYTPGSAPSLEAMDADLAQLEQAFNGVNFDKVVSLANPTSTQLKAEINAAALRADAEGQQRGTLTVVYYAGHGAMVGHASYLLASDYVPPEVAPEIVLQGGISTAFVGEAFSRIGQPAILIVEACRNAYVPGRNARTIETGNTDAGDDVDQDLQDQMIQYPDRVHGYGVFFAQQPGHVVTLPPRVEGQASLLSRLIAEYLPVIPSAPNLLSHVGRELVNRNPYPLRPGYDGQLSGQVMLHYTPTAAAQDQMEWENSLALGRDFVGIFLNLYRTSRYVPVAREWLRTNVETTNEVNHVVYSRELQRYLGRKPRLFFPRAIRDVVSSSALIGTGEDRVPVRDIALLQRTEGPGLAHYEARTFDNRIIAFDGPAIAADPSTVPDYWSSETEAIDCDTETIAGGACQAVMRLVELAREDPEFLGTIHVAGVVNRAGQPEAADAVFHRLRAVGEQLRANGIPDGRVRFRSFFDGDLPSSARATLLVKRGVGKRFALE